MIDFREKASILCSSMSHTDTITQFIAIFHVLFENSVDVAEIIVQRYEFLSTQITQCIIDADLGILTAI